MIDPIAVRRQWYNRIDVTRTWRQMLLNPTVTEDERLLTDQPLEFWRTERFSPSTLGR
jgi:hypothetical protein